MRLVPNADRSAQSTQDDWLAELEAALDGDARSPGAESWRELRADVRSLAPAIEPSFECELQERLAAPNSKASSSLDRAATTRVPRRFPRLRIRNRPDRQGSPTLRLRRARDARAPLLVAAVAAIVVALLVIAPWHRGGSESSSSSGSAKAVSVGSLQAKSGASSHASSSAPSAAGAAGTAGTEQAVSPTSSEALSGGRLQQLASTITLRSAPSDVQSTSDRVARLVTREGGFVQSSHVQTQSGRKSEAELVLHVPSAKLGTMLAALARIAPVSAETQSLQDITAAHESAQRKLGQAKAERRALLRSLSQASTEEEVQALQQRLSRVGKRISSAEASVQAIARRASTAEVEVSIVGAAQTGGGKLTLDRGLHDALHVLTVTVVVLLLAAALLLPLALALALSLAGLRAWRRYWRERALGAS